MGTQAYIVLLSEVPFSKKQRFSYSSNMVDDLSDLLDEPFDDDGEKTFPIHYSTTSCRELILDVVEPAFSESSTMYSAIRCFGEQHHRVAGVFRRKKGSSALVSKVLSEIFGTPISVSYGFLGKKAKPTDNPFSRNSELSMGGKSKKVNGYITMHMPYIDAHPTNGILFLIVSTVIALLREPRVIKGILDGNVTDVKSLTISLLDIARDRKYQLDNSYNCWMLSGSIQKQSILHALSNYEYNGDGSDYASIAALAFFILAYTNKGTRLSVPDTNDVNGPISYLDDFIEDSQIRDTVNTVKSWGVDLEFLCHIQDTAYMNLAEVYVDTLGAEHPERDDEYNYDDDEDDDDEDVW